MSRTAGWVVGAALVLAMVGCGVQQGAGGTGGASGSDESTPVAAQPPDEAPYVTGVVVSVTPVEPVVTDCVSESDLDPNGTVSSDDPPVCNPNPGVFGTVHVKGDTEVVATVGKAVPIMRRSGDALEPIAFEDLSAGSKASVWMEGPIMESFPAQGAAAFVLVED